MLILYSISLLVEAFYYWIVNYSISLVFNFDLMLILYFFFFLPTTCSEEWKEEEEEEKTELNPINAMGMIR